MLTFLKTSLLVLVLIFTIVWGMLAIYYGDSQTSVVQSCVALIFGFFGLLTLISLAWAKWRKHFLTIYPILFIMVLIWWWAAVKPSNERQWQPDLAKLPYAEVEGDNITIHNVRNFDYRSEFDYTPAYYTKTYDLKELVGIDLFAIYWMGPAIAHTIISFNFSDKDYLAVSIEARKELGEGYLTIKGFFRQYELTYIVADERDVIRLRTNYRKDPPEAVHLYRLQARKQNMRRLFLEYLRKINELHEKPTFYNTMLHNCTTAIWFNTRVYPEHLPFSWKILLSGYVPEYLYESKSLNNQLTFEKLQRLAYINPVAQATDQSPDFSWHIRAGHEKPKLQ